MSTTPESTTSGSATSRSNSRNRNNRQRGNRAGAAVQATRAATTTATSATAVRRTTFKGATAGMNGNVFECFEEQSDRNQYKKTVAALDAYVKLSMDGSIDLAPLFAVNRSVPTIALPVKMAESDVVNTELVTLLFSEAVKSYVKRTHVLESNLATVYSIIWGQCSENMQARLKTHKEYEVKSVANDCIWLLKHVRAVTLRFDETKHGYTSLLDAQFFSYRAGRQQLRRPTSMRMT